MKNAMKEQIATLQEMYDGASDATKDEIVSKVINLAATENNTVEENADATTANVEEQIATLQEMYDGANDATKDEIVNKVINLAATEEPATVEETATVEKTVAERFLEAKKEIRLSRGRYLGNNRFADQWQRHNGFRWYNISKKTAAQTLKFHGLTIDEFLTEQKNYVDNEVAKSLAQMAIDDQADFISDKVRREVKAADEDVFSLLPALDELNDVGEFNGTSDALNKITVFNKDGDEITTIVIGDEVMRLYNGELWSIRSLKYCARWSNMATLVGWYVSNGNKPWRKITDADEFFKEMERRGACTIEPGTPEPADYFKADCQGITYRAGIKAQGYGGEIYCVVNRDGVAVLNRNPDKPKTAWSAEVDANEIHRLSFRLKNAVDYRDAIIRELGADYDDSGDFNAEKVIELDAHAAAIEAELRYKLQFYTPATDAELADMKAKAAAAQAKKQKLLDRQQTILKAGKVPDRKILDEISEYNIEQVHWEFKLKDALAANEAYATFNGAVAKAQVDEVFKDRKDICRELINRLGMLCRNNTNAATA